MNLSLSSYVTLYSDITRTSNTYLLDTGANISTLKISTLRDNTQINNQNSCQINGIIEGIVKTKGSIDTYLLNNDIELEYQLQIVDDDFPVPADGILGLDFIRKYNCKLDYDQNNWK